jgi:hypothetical protein
MITLNQFINKYIWKQVDVDNYPSWDKTQCVDLLKKYYPEVLGVPAIRGDGGDYFANSPSTQFRKIYNSYWAIPRAGDVMVWKETSRLPFGHVAIVTSANLYTFTSFDQNWPSQTSPCMYVKHKYTGDYPVLGWLRKK